MIGHESTREAGEEVTSKPDEAFTHAQYFKAVEDNRKVGLITGMIEQFGRMVTDLGREIATEEQRSGVSDTKDTMYPTYARAARQRQENLQQAIDELKGQLKDLTGESEAETGKPVAGSASRAMDASPV